MTAVTNDGHYTARAQRRPDGGIDVSLSLTCNGEHVETHTVWEDGTTELQAAEAAVREASKRVVLTSDDLHTVNPSLVFRLYVPILGPDCACATRRAAVRMHAAICNLNQWWEDGDVAAWADLTVLDMCRYFDAVIAVNTDGGLVGMRRGSYRASEPAK